MKERKWNWKEEILDMSAWNDIKKEIEIWCKRVKWQEMFSKQRFAVLSVALTQRKKLWHFFFVFLLFASCWGNKWPSFRTNESSVTCLTFWDKIPKVQNERQESKFYWRRSRRKRLGICLQINDKEMRFLSPFSRKRTAIKEEENVTSLPSFFSCYCCCYPCSLLGPVVSSYSTFIKRPTRE